MVAIKNIRKLFRRTKKKKEKILPSPRPPPPTHCDGYPYAMVPTDLEPGEEVSFYVSSGDDDLACTLYRCLPDNGGDSQQHAVERMNLEIDKSIPVIVICHGYMSWRNQMLLAHLARGLHKKKYHVLRFDFAGNGHSTGSWSAANYEGELTNLKSIVSFVRDDLRCRVQCIVGHSKGATTRRRVDSQSSSLFHETRELGFATMAILGPD